MNHHSSRGFTLVEVVLSLTVAAGVAIAVFSTFQLIESARIQQESYGIVTWESDLILGRVRNLIVGGFTEPSPQGASEILRLSDGSEVKASGSVLYLMRDGASEALSSGDVRVSSLSFQDRGTPETPGLLRMGFTVSSVASDSRQSYELRIDTSLYE